MRCREMDIDKFNEFNVLKEEVEKFTSRCVQSLVNARRPHYLKQKLLEYFL